MRSYNPLFSKFSFLTSSTLSVSAMVVLLSTTLAACAQTDTLNVADTSKTEPVPSASSAAQIVPVPPITNPDLLK